jgi:hypothetical protein
MPTWKKEFRGALIEASERRNNPATLKINGLAVEVQHEGKNFVSPAAFGIFISLEALSVAVIRQQQARVTARPKILVRRDVATLDSAMRDRFVQALLRMKATGEYDRFAEIHHRNVDRCWAKWQALRRRKWLADNPELPYPEKQAADDYFYDGSIPERTWQRKGHNLEDMMWPWNGSRSADTGVSLPPWNQPGGAKDQRPRYALNHAAFGFNIYDTEIGWDRVKGILDHSLLLWAQDRGYPANMTRHGFRWETKQDLLAARAYGFRLIEENQVGQGKGSHTNLVIAFREPFGVQGLGRMPLDGPYIPDYEIEEIRIWIDAGCPD